MWGRAGEPGLPAWQSADLGDTGAAPSGGSRAAPGRTVPSFIASKGDGRIGASPGNDGPWLLEPARRDYAFGGERLRRYGKRLAGRTAETWEFSLYPGRESRIGPHGQRLDRFLADAWGLDAPGLGALPLVKLLDVAGALPVHVHPGDAQAASMTGADPGKDEAWLILEAGPEAAVYLGLAAPLTDGEVARAVADGSLRERLTRFVPRAGDVVMVPSGVPHSARDVVFWEVQQRSDRSLLAEAVDLWGRPLAPDAVRAQVAAFLAVARRGAVPRALCARGVLDAAPGPGERLALAGCAHFAMEAWGVGGEATLPPGAYTVHSGRVAGDGAAEATLGQSFLIGPRPARVTAGPEGACLLRAWLPDAHTTAALEAAGRHFEAL